MREAISKIQTMRKEADFNVTDHITVFVQGSEKACGLLKAHEAELCREVLAEEVSFTRMDGYQKEWDLNGEAVTLGVKQR